MDNDFPNHCPFFIMLLLTKLVTFMVIPPFNILILWLFSFLFRLFHWKTLSRLCAVLGFSILYVCSTPYFSQKLVQAVSFQQKFAISDYQNAQAIVVLGGGIRDSHELFANYAITGSPLERMRYAAYLHKQTQLPVLVTGGSPEQRDPEGIVMARELQDFFNVPVKWVESNSNTTEENAILTKQILQKEGVSTIVLVTNEWHMRRAKMLFEREGFTVLAAGTGTHHALGMSFLRFVPQPQALDKSSLALKEWLGYWKEVLEG